MKTNGMRLVCTILCLFVCVAISAQGSAKKLMGEWFFSASQAPNGYQEGTCHFKEKAGKWTAVAKVHGSEITISEITKDNTGVYKCNFYVDGAPVELTFKIEKENRMDGTVYAQGSNIPVRFEKKK